MRNTFKILFFAFFLLMISCTDKKKENKKIDENKIIKVEVKTPLDSILKQEISLKHPSEFSEKLIYTVQVGAFKNEKSLLENNEGVTSVQDGTLIKYRLGHFENYNKAIEFKQSILSLYPDAFIVPINKGIQIDITEALKLSSEI